MSSFVLKQTGRFVENFAAYLADILHTASVDIFMSTERTQQGVGVSTIAALVTFHAINNNDFSGNAFALDLGDGLFVGLLLLGMRSLVGLASDHRHEPLAAVNALDGFLRFFMRSQVLVQQPYRRYNDRRFRITL